MSKVRSILSSLRISSSSTRQFRAMRKAVIGTTLLLVAALSISAVQIGRNGYPFFVFRAGGVGETAGTNTDQQFLARTHQVLAASFSGTIKTQWQRLRMVGAKPVALMSFMTYTVQRGDTLSSIAAREYGNADRWPALWWVNRGQVHNPNDISVGQKIRINTWHPAASWLTRAADAAIPAPPKPVTISVTHHSSPTPAAPEQSGPVSTSGDSSFQACVIRAESGGNPQVMNASGHWGLYQFSFSTWVAHGGDPALFGNADQAYQNEIFWNTFRADGTSDWAPYDGC